MHSVNILRTRTGLGHPETAGLVKKAICAALDSEGVDRPCRVDVTLTDDETIRNINYEQRGVDRPTDVLSFPMNELQPGQFDTEICEIDMDTGDIFLGDMVISVPRCQVQGEEYGHGYKREVSYLAVHSVLHLLGYDHIDEGEDNRLMRAREEAVMSRLGTVR